MIPHAAHLPPISTARRRRGWQALLLLAVLCGAAFAAACSDEQPPTPADLHIPGVMKIPGVEQVEQQRGNHVIAGLTTYLSASDHQPHVLFEYDATAYDVQLDGSGLRPTAIACGLNSVSPDQHWLACSDSTGIILVDLQTPASSRSDHPIIKNGDSYYVDNPTWAPDNRHLAVILRSECAIAIYRASTDYSTFTMTMTLPLTDFSPGGGGCNANGLAWSPDGAWLALEDYNPAYQTIYGLPLTRLPEHGLANPSPAVTIPIGHQQLVAFARTDRTGTAVWSPIPNMLTYVDQQGRAIQEVDVVTGHQTTLLGQQAAGIFALSWTPDGKHLVFVYGFPFDLNPPPPQQIYVYTPLATGAGT